MAKISKKYIYRIYKPSSQPSILIIGSFYEVFGNGC